MKIKLINLAFEKLIMYSQNAILQVFEYFLEVARIKLRETGRFLARRIHTRGQNPTVSASKWIDRWSPLSYFRRFDFSRVFDVPLARIRATGQNKSFGRLHFARNPAGINSISPNIIYYRLSFGSTVVSRSRCTCRSVKKKISHARLV